MSNLIGDGVLGVVWGFSRGVAAAAQAVLDVEPIRETVKTAVDVVDGALVVTEVVGVETDLNGEDVVEGVQEAIDYVEIGIDAAVMAAAAGTGSVGVAVAAGISLAQQVMNEVAEETETDLGLAGEIVNVTAAATSGVFAGGASVLTLVQQGAQAAAGFGQIALREAGEAEAAAVVGASSSLVALDAGQLASKAAGAAVMGAVAVASDDGKSPLQAAAIGAQTGASLGGAVGAASTGVQKPAGAEGSAPPEPNGPDAKSPKAIAAHREALLESVPPEHRGAVERAALQKALQTQRIEGSQLKESWTLSEGITAETDVGALQETVEAYHRGERIGGDWERVGLAALDEVARLGMAAVVHHAADDDGSVVDSYGATAGLSLASGGKEVLDNGTGPGAASTTVPALVENGSAAARMAAHVEERKAAAQAELAQRLAKLGVDRPSYRAEAAAKQATAENLRAMADTGTYTGLMRRGLPRTEDESRVSVG